MLVLLIAGEVRIAATHFFKPFTMFSALVQLGKLSPWLRTLTSNRPLMTADCPAAASVIHIETNKVPAAPT